MAQTHRQRIGSWGERVAAFHLEQRGYSILGRNVRTPHGEIDLLARAANGELVIVEVKTRTNASYGLPETAVDSRKLEHLYRAAEAYLLEHSEWKEAAWRIDVIAIQGKPGDKVEDVVIEHFENISA